MHATDTADDSSNERASLAPFVAVVVLTPIAINLWSDVQVLIRGRAWIVGDLGTREAIAFQGVFATLVVAIFVALRGQAVVRHVRPDNDTYFTILYFALFALGTASASVGWNQLVAGGPDYLALSSLLNACVSAAIVTLAAFASQMVPSGLLRGLEQRLAERQAITTELSRRNLLESSGTVGTAILWCALLVSLPAITYITAVAAFGRSMSLAGVISDLALCALATTLFFVAIAAFACSMWQLLAFSAMLSLLLVVGLIGSWGTVGSAGSVTSRQEVVATVLLILSFGIWWAILYRGLIRLTALRPVLLALVRGASWCRDRQDPARMPRRSRTGRRWRVVLRALVGRGELPDAPD
jgi:hypothetical protein